VNPFDALGLPATTALTDLDVRDAWRSIAAATHPDQDGGGNPAAYAAASAAYAQLRTGWGRGEALADLAAQARPGTRHRELELRPGLPEVGWRAVAQLPARVRHGRPGRLILRTIAAAAAAVTAVTLTAGTPAAPATAAGCLLWWACTACGDLAPPPGR
jgi:curved DNA-binding protein CbpA